MRTDPGALSLLAIAAALLAGCGDSGHAETVPGRSQANPLDQQETALLQAVNDLREQHGTPAVRACTTLNVSASLHSDDMRDRNYTDADGPDGSTPTSRACDAGYQAACEMGANVAEMVATGPLDGGAALAKWTEDPGSTANIVDEAHEAVGIGRAPSGDASVWTLDLAGAYEPSCD
jgi:uncharacterized protein YkwD